MFPVSAPTSDSALVSLSFVSSLNYLTDSEKTRGFSCSLDEISIIYNDLFLGT